MLDATGRITGYKTVRGADTVFPFINLSPDNNIYNELLKGNNGLGSNTYIFTKDYSFVYCIQSSFGVTGNGFENGIQYAGKGTFTAICNRSTTSDNTISGKLFVNCISNVKKGDTLTFGGPANKSGRIRSISIFAFA